MKILMLADVFFPDTIGGAGRVLYSLSCELGLLDHEIHIMTRNRGRRFPSVQRVGENVEVHRFSSPMGAGLNALMSEIHLSYILAKALSKKCSFDLVCTHQSFAAIGPLLSRSFNNRPFIHFFYSPWHSEYLAKIGLENERAAPHRVTIAQCMKWIEKRILLTASRQIVLSNYSKNQMMEIHGLPEEKIVTVPAGVDLVRFHPTGQNREEVLREAHMPFHKTVFLTIRNLVPRMGIENLIEAFHSSPRLQERGLLLIGGEGFLRRDLENMVSQYGLKECVRFLGRIPEEDLPRAYQLADYFVLPTRELEGFGLVILEAMACGTPVLGTPVGAIPELIAPFEGRLLFRGSDYLSIKSKLDEVIDDPERYRFKPEECRKFVEERYSWKRMAQAFEQVAFDVTRSASGHSRMGM